MSRVGRSPRPGLARPTPGRVGLFRPARGVSGVRCESPHRLVPEGLASAGRGWRCSAVDLRGREYGNPIVAWRIPAAARRRYGQRRDDAHSPHRRRPRRLHRPRRRGPHLAPAGAGLGHVGLGVAAVQHGDHDLRVLRLRHERELRGDERHLDGAGHLDRHLGALRRPPRARARPELRPLGQDRAQPARSRRGCSPGSRPRSTSSSPSRRSCGSGWCCWASARSCRRSRG